MTPVCVYSLSSISVSPQLPLLATTKAIGEVIVFSLPMEDWQIGPFYGTSYTGGRGAWASGGGVIRYPQFDASKSSITYSGETDEVIPSSTKVILVIKY